MSSTIIDRTHTGPRVLRRNDARPLPRHLGPAVPTGTPGGPPGVPPVVVTIALGLSGGELPAPVLHALRALQAVAEAQLATVRIQPADDLTTVSVPAAPSTPALSTPALSAVAPVAAPVRAAVAMSLRTASRQVFVAGQPLHLTRREFDLLAFLCANPRQVFSRGHLLRRVWGTLPASGERTIDVHIRRLRVKLGDRGPTIVTVHGVGYRLDNVDRISLAPSPRCPAHRSSTPH